MVKLKPHGLIESHAPIRIPHISNHCHPATASRLAAVGIPEEPAARTEAAAPGSGAVRVAAEPAGIRNDRAEALRAHLLEASAPADTGLRVSSLRPIPHGKASVPSHAKLIHAYRSTCSNG